MRTCTWPSATEPSLLVERAAREVTAGEYLNRDDTAAQFLAGDEEHRPEWEPGVERPRISVPGPLVRREGLLVRRRIAPRTRALS
jgi:hypothetical protein